MGDAREMLSGALEQSVLGHVREHDVPGYGIPSRYFQYVRSGDERPLVAVLEHNRLDLLSLALLTARAAQLLEEGAAAVRRPLARRTVWASLYQRAGLLDHARACFARASVISEIRPLHVRGGVARMRGSRAPRASTR